VATDVAGLEGSFSKPDSVDERAGDWREATGVGARAATTLSSASKIA
jgi:hypothetical protein